jgi:adenosine deaminase
MLAEVVSRAGHENAQYLELILDPTKKQPASRVGAGVGLHDNDFAALRQQLLDKPIERVVAAARLDLDDAEKKMAQILRCGTLDADPGCDVKVRYLYEVHRALPPDQVFAEMIAGFEMANADPRVVGVNLVMPEDAFVSMRDFDLHMKMLAYLHSVYPKVRLTLHAGELAPHLVPPEGLRFHIRESVEVGRAERIGHGDDIMYERDPIGLLKEMAKRRVLVEICLTSNDLILGLRGAQHPLPMYLRYGVPVALATDDEGVSRSDLVQEFVRAIQTYGLKYSDLKRMVRDSAEHAFLPGDSLWAGFPEHGVAKRVPACSSDRADGEPQSQSCRNFLKGSERAQLQWRIERAWSQFEAACCREPAAIPQRATPPSP